MDRVPDDGEPGGGGWPADRIELRVAALEKSQELVIGKLDGIAKGIADGRLESEKRFSVIESRLTGIEAKLDAKAAKTDLAPIEIKLGSVEGRLSNIPTTWQIVGIVAALMVGMAGVSFTIAKLGEGARQPAVSSTPLSAPSAPGKAP